MIKDDTISRQAVINLIKRSINFKNIVFESRRYDLLESEDEGAMVHDVEALPSAQPQRKSAYLIDPNPYGKCSNCGQLIDIRDEYNYCPNCGADMRGKDNDG